MDKRDVFTLYQIHDILGLWDMTMSCIKGNNCGECWQCHERKWAEAL